MKTVFRNLRGMVATAMCAALLFLSLPASAIDTELTVPNIPATLATTVGTNLATAYVFDVQKQRQLPLIFSFNQSAASTSNVVYWLRPGIGRDGPWASNETWVVTIASQGTTVVHHGTNFDTQGWPFVRIYAISNATALTTWTNHGVTWNPLGTGSGK